MNGEVSSDPLPLSGRKAILLVKLEILARRLWPQLLSYVLNVLLKDSV